MSHEFFERKDPGGDGTKAIEAALQVGQAPIRETPVSDLRAGMQVQAYDGMYTVESVRDGDAGQKRVIRFLEPGVEPLRVDPDETVSTLAADRKE